MMRNLKELRAKLFEMYRAMKTEESPFAEYLRGEFADELYTEALNELKAKADTAAEGTAMFSIVQAMALKARKKLMERVNLKFRESEDQLLETMAGFEVFDFKIEKINEKNLLALCRTNGDKESVVYAEMPDLKKDQILFVLEPFGTIGDEERIASEMSQEEREKVASNMRNASSMPKRLMKRRVKITDIQLRHDNRTGWLEVHYEEIELHSRTTQELDAITEEFHPSKEVKDETTGAAQQEETASSSETDIDELTSDVNSENIDDEDLHAELQAQSQTSADDISKILGDETIEVPE